MNAIIKASSIKNITLEFAKDVNIGYYYIKFYKEVTCMQAGVRNQLTGKITEIKKGNIMAQVAVKVGDNEITSVLTKESLESAGFKEGDTVTALIKAVNVVLVK